MPTENELRVYGIRTNCSVLFERSLEEICDLFFALLLQDEENIWKMYSRLISNRLEHRKEDMGAWEIVRDILEQICVWRVYIEIVFRQDSQSGKWKMYIWPFGVTKSEDLERGIKRPNIHIEPNTETNIYIMQCAQIMILSNVFSIRNTDIYGFHFVYTSMDREFNIHGNSFFDKSKVIGIILSRVFSVYTRFFPIIAAYNKNATSTIKEDIKNCLDFTSNLETKEKEDILQIVVQNTDWELS